MIGHQRPRNYAGCWQEGKGAFLKNLYIRRLTDTSSYWLLVPGPMLPSQKQSSSFEAFWTHGDSSHVCTHLRLCPALQVQSTSSDGAERNKSGKREVNSHGSPSFKMGFGGPFLTWKFGRDCIQFQGLQLFWVWIQLRNKLKGYTRRGHEKQCKKPRQALL